MEGIFEIKKVTSNSTYEYKNDDVIVTGSYAKDVTNGQLQSLNGQCYRNNNGAQGEFFGNFNGVPRSNGEIRYSMSEMSRQDANIVWDAIDEIEPCVLNDGEPTNE